MKIGVALVFKEKDNQVISGVLKSLVLDIEIGDFKNKVNEIGNKIAKHFSYIFLGINDVFIVTGEPKEGEILGRTSYFDYDDINKAKELKNQFLENVEGTFICSLIYFCSNKIGEKFTLTILTVLKLKNTDFDKKIDQIANEINFKNKIIEISVDGIDELYFVGVESLERTDLKFNVFETLYSDFVDLDALSQEILSSDDLDEILNDVFKE